MEPSESSPAIPPADAVRFALYNRFLKGEAKVPRLSDFRLKGIFADLTAAAARVADRHGDGVNVLYGNGAARWVPLAAFAQPAAQWPEPAFPPAATFNGTQDAIWAAFDQN